MAYSKTTKLIMKHLSFEKTDLGFASVKYFAETGQISGEFYGRVKDMVDEALAENLDARQSALPMSHVSNSFCDHHINDCQHVKLVKYCTFKDVCTHKRAI